MGPVAVLTKGISFVTAVPQHTLGDVVEYGGDTYRYVYNKNTATAKVGYAVYYSASTGYSVMMQSFTTDVDAAAGVIKHVDIPYGEYGWMLTKGFAPAVAGLNTGLALGDKVIMVSTTNTGNIARKSAHTVYSQLAGEPIPFGYVVQAAATAAEGTIYVTGT